MAKTLPFVVQPRRDPIKIEIGSDESGKIEIERRGYLTVAERFYVNQVVSSDRTMGIMVSLANKIAKKVKKTPGESYTLIGDYLQGKTTPSDTKAIDENFSEEIQDLTSEMTRVASTRELAQATVIMQSRIDDEWTTQDTLALHPDLLSGLVELYNAEDSREFPEAATKSGNQPSYEDAVGK